MAFLDLELFLHNCRRHTAIALTLVASCLLAVSAAHEAWAAASGTSGCVACHTDVAKLKALTPPDPPPTEEGEG